MTANLFVCGNARHTGDLPRDAELQLGIRAVTVPVCMPPGIERIVTRSLNGNGIVDEGDLVEYFDNNTSGTVMQRWYDWNLNGAYDKGDWGYFAKFDDNGNEIEKWNEIVENSQS